MVHKFPNARQARMGHNMVKSRSPNAPSTWLIFLCPHTYASPQTCHHSASSVFGVQVSCCVIAVFVFRKPLFIVLMAPKRNSSAGSASKPERRHDVLSIYEWSRLLIVMHCFLKDPELDGTQRIALLQQKLQELRKTYMNVKAELACIDRRRKKLRRREREGEIPKIIKN